MFDDLHALVEFAQAGSIAGAADRLFRTPSAVTRQLQRLEAELGVELLDRSTKPPRLNSMGSRVLERARDMLQRAEAMRSLASPDAENKVNAAATYGFMVDVALVEIDPVTFVPRVLKYMAVHDVGAAINPQLIRGQIAGGIIHGID